MTEHANSILIIHVRLTGNSYPYDCCYILIEVHSDSTYQQDISTRLRCYKQLESVQHIVYLEQGVPYVSVYTKQPDNRHWLNEDFDSLEAIVPLGTYALPIRDIYHKISLSPAKSGETESNVSC